MSPARSAAESEAPTNIGLSDLSLKTVLSLITTILECSRAGLTAQLNNHDNTESDSKQISHVSNHSNNNPDIPEPNHPEILLKLETTAVMQGLRCLYKLYKHFYPTEPKVLNAVLDAECLAMRRMSSEPSKWKHVGNLVITTLLSIEDEDKFKVRAKRLHPYFCKLVAHQFPSEVATNMRINLKDYFSKLGKISGITE